MILSLDRGRQLQRVDELAVELGADQVEVTFDRDEPEGLVFAAFYRHDGLVPLAVDEEGFPIAEHYVDLQGTSTYER